MTVISVRNLYTLTWVSTLLFVVNLVRTHTSAQLFETEDWETVYNVVRTSINVLLALCLLWVTRRKKSIEGEFGWKVALVMLFLIDWSTYVRHITQVLQIMTVGRILAWIIFIGLTVFVASTVVDWTTARPR